MKGIKLVFLILLAGLFLSLGFLRDFVFLNVNEQSRIAYYHSPDSFLSPSMAFLTAWSYPQLYYLKWVLTFFFAGLFMVLTLAFVRLLFPARKYLRWTILAYGILLLLAGLFFIGGYLAGQSENGYRIARFLLGMAQSPIVLMVLLPAFRLADRSDS
jgi:hypothetical protein